VGDEALVAVADLLSAEGFAGRLGGDEFARLSDGRIGAVTPGGAPTRPRVRVVWCRRGERLEHEGMVDLVADPRLFIDAGARP
jgi:hypothetical protein